LRGSKDAALAYTARTLFNTRFSRIGEMTEFSVDTKNQAFRVQLDLIGESEPIEIHVRKYSLERKGNNVTLIVDDATASRKWLSEVLREFVVGRRFPIPATAGAILKLLA
jgi:hypothetical protein